MTVREISVLTNSHLPWLSDLNPMKTVSASTNDGFPEYDVYIARWGDDALFLHDDVIKWKHFPRYWPFVRGIHRSPVISPHKGQWRGALMFSLICVWINGWVNRVNREAGDFRRYLVHNDVIVMNVMKWKQTFAKRKILKFRRIERVIYHFWRTRVTITKSIMTSSAGLHNQLWRHHKEVNILN